MSRSVPAVDPIAARLLAEGAVLAERCVGNADGSVALVRQPFAATEGAMGAGAGVRIGLLMAGGGHLHQRTALGRIDARWRPGQINVALPGCTGEFRSPAMDLLGLVVDMPRFTALEGMRVDDLQAAAAGLHADPVVSSVLAALWHCADAHAGASAFFEHGVALVLQRLGRLAGCAPPPATSPRALPRASLARVRDLIDARLGEDIRVACMASVAGRDSSSFSRGFRQATGMTPYAYLTWRRMEVAKAMLLDGRAVTEVALAVGYANPGKFAAAFRRVVGLAPSAWRR